MTIATRTLITLAALSLAGAAYAADFSKPQPSGQPLPNTHTQSQQQTTDYNKTEPAAGDASDDADKTPASTGKKHKHHTAHHTAPAPKQEQPQQ